MFLVLRVNAGNRSEKLSAHLDMTPEAVNTASMLMITFKL